MICDAYAYPSRYSKCTANALLYCYEDIKIYIDNDEYVREDQEITYYKLHNVHSVRLVFFFF